MKSLPDDVWRHYAELIDQHLYHTHKSTSRQLRTLLVPFIFRKLTILDYRKLTRLTRVLEANSSLASHARTLEIVDDDTFWDDEGSRSSPALSRERRMALIEYFKLLGHAVFPYLRDFSFTLDVASKPKSRQ